MAPPVSDRLQLSLWGSEEAEHSQAPWGGRSPRELTSAYTRFTLKAQADKSVSDFVDVDQYDLWLTIKKAPWIYQGAPLLKALEGG